MDLCGQFLAIGVGEEETAGAVATETEAFLLVVNVEEQFLVGQYWLIVRFPVIWLSIPHNMICTDDQTR